MQTEALQGILIPCTGTILGAACVFFTQHTISLFTQRIFSGFAAGIMVAASVWSLLIPAIESCQQLGKFGSIPAVIGFLIGIFFLLLLDKWIPHLHQNSETAEGIPSHFHKNTMLLLAVTLHNLPEGMAVGVVYAALMAGGTSISPPEALALTIGIAVQNFPEGAIISLPLAGQGIPKRRAFFWGVMSGLAEPFGAIVTLLAASMVVPLLPYFLGFAAGAMVYVVVEELVPEISQPPHSDIGTIAFAVGFSAMMLLDTILG